MIRKATITDFPAGCEASLADAIANHTIMPIDPAKFMSRVHGAVQAGEVIVAEVDGNIVGSLAYEEFTPYYSTDAALHDLWVHVHPDHRGSTVGGRLLAEFAKEAKRRGVPYFVGASGNAPDAEKVYDRHYQLVSKTYKGF